MAKAITDAPPHCEECGEPLEEDETYEVTVRGGTYYVCSMHCVLKLIFRWN